MDLVECTVHYLEMLSHTPRQVPAPRQDLQVERIPRPSIPFYRSLYNAVGDQYRWLSRRKMTDQALAEILSDPLVEIHVLSVESQPAGFAELDRRQSDEIELVQFGLVPEFIGQGLGKWFLNWTIEKAWTFQPRRFWLHTCSFDHPAALPNYQKAGFREYKQETIRRDY